MYAIVDIAGQQYKVEKDQKIFVHRIEGEEGSKVDFDKVLLIDNDSKVVVGAPVIEGAQVSAKILGHLKGDKVIVFKKKRRKGYQKSNGHRQYLSQIVIEEIVEEGAKKAIASAGKKEAKPVAENKETAPAAEKKETKPAAEKATASEAAASKKTQTNTSSAGTAEKKKTTAGKTTTAKKPATAAKKPAAKKAEPKKTDKDSE